MYEWPRDRRGLTPGPVGKIRPVHVLLVNSHGGDRALGGAERYVDVLRSGLEAVGLTCAVLSAYPVREGRGDALGVLHDTDWRDDRRRRTSDHLGSWAARPNQRLAAAVRAARPDLVHTHNLYGIATGVWACAQALGVPVVHTLHDYGLLCPRTTLRRRDGSPCRPHPLLCGLRTRRLDRWAPAVGAVIGVSAHVLAVHERLFGARTARHVIRAPLGLALHDRVGTALPLPAGRLQTLGFAGRLDDHKGVAALLRAAPALAAGGVRVRIAGDGPLRAAVAASPDVDYAGRLDREALATFLGSCDAGIVPSQWDEPGVTFAALEWLGAGRPVLATSAGGLAELPAAGVTRIVAGAEGIVAGVRALRAAERWETLRASVPAVNPSAARGDAERFAAAHLSAYTEAAAWTTR